MSLTVTQQFRIKVASALGARDFVLVERLFFQYGGYLELTNANGIKSFGVLAVAVPHRPLMQLKENEMSALNQQETDALRDAYTRCSAVRAALTGIASAPATLSADRKRLEGMVASLKIAEDKVKTVHAMKGHYPS